MLVNPRIRQIMPAPPGWRELAVNRGHMQPFSADPDDDVEVWPIVGFALVEEMQWRASDHACGRASDDIDLCDCEPTKVEEQVVSAMVMTSRYSDIELAINIFNVDDATWRRVTTLQPGDDVEDWMDAAREALAEEKARAARWRADSAHHHPTVQ